MTTVLDQIVAETRERLGSLHGPELAARARRVALARAPHTFMAALESRHPVRVIAEIKAASPSAGLIVPSVDAAMIASSYARAGAVAISVVTEQRYFRGALSWIGEAAEASALPVIMKDFVIDELQVLEGIASGASAMLLLASLLGEAELRTFIELMKQFGVDALVEVHDEQELDVALRAGARIIGINNRDLRDFSVSLDTGERLVRHIPRGVLTVSESGIRTRMDLDRLKRAGFDAFLVGTSLLAGGDPGGALRELLETDHGC